MNLDRTMQAAIAIALGTVLRNQLTSQRQVEEGVFTKSRMLALHLITAMGLPFRRF